MKLVTFGLDWNVLQRHSSEIYEIETVSVHINDLNEEADSYSTISKSYTMVNPENCIQQCIQRAVHV